MRVFINKELVSACIKSDITLRCFSISNYFSAKPFRFERSVFKCNFIWLLNKLDYVFKN